MADQPNRTAEGIKLAVFVMAIGFLAFVAGGVATFLKWSPVELFMQRTAMVALYLYKSNVDDVKLHPFWRAEHLPGPSDGNPIIHHDRSKAQQGLNLVVGSNAQEALLLTMDGDTVHRWALDFRDAWDDPPQMPAFTNEEPEYWADKIYWRRVHLYPNGDLLVVFESPFITPYGLGLVKIDRNSNIIWKLDKNAHHDTAIGEDGMVYVLTQEITETAYAGLPELAPPFIDDMVTVVRQDGSWVKDIPIIKALRDSHFAPMLSRLDRNLEGDVIHANTVQYIDRATAERYPFAKAGHLMISLREMDVIAILDPVEERIVWAMTGMWQAQHEPQMLSNGRILIYDNKGGRGPAGMTRVIEVNPVTNTVDWSYGGTEQAPLISPFYGSQQRLHNGNTLIIESTNGRAIEVTDDGDIVWEYRSPYRLETDINTLVMMLFDIVRIDPETLSFLEQ
jgi:hypothetical protein